MTKPRFAMGGWFNRRAAAFAAGAAAMALVTVSVAYGVIALQARSSAPQAAGTTTAATLAAVASPPSAPPARSPAVGDPPRSTSGTSAPIPQSTSGLAGAEQGRPADADVSYSVLVGSFRQESEAAALSQQLQGLAFRVRTTRVGSIDRGMWYQVFVGPYTDLEGARRDLERVRQMPGYSDARLITR